MAPVAAGGRLIHHRPRRRLEQQFAQRHGSRRRKFANPRATETRPLPLRVIAILAYRGGTDARNGRRAGAQLEAPPAGRGQARLILALGGAFALTVSRAVVGPSPACRGSRGPGVDPRDNPCRRQGDRVVAPTDACSSSGAGARRTGTRGARIWARANALLPFGTRSSFSVCGSCACSDGPIRGTRAATGLSRAAPARRASRGELAEAISPGEDRPRSPTRPPARAYSPPRPRQRWRARATSVVTHNWVWPPLIS
jgi:hypothetical protein